MNERTMFRHKLVAAKFRVMRAAFLGFRKNATVLERFQLQISQHELYAEDDTLVDELLYQMATEPILHVCKYLLPFGFFRLISRLTRAV